MDAEKRALWRDMTVRLVLAARAEYLAAGASPLKHWDQIKDRMRAAASTSGSASEWTTSLLRGLGLGAPGNPLSLATDALVTSIEMDGADDAFLAFVEAEHGLVLARARLESERRAATWKEREAKRTKTDTATADLTTDESNPF